MRATPLNHTLVMGLLAIMAACTPASQGPNVGSPPGDLPLKTQAAHPPGGRSVPAQALKARQITENTYEEDRIRGLREDGRPGDYVLANDAVRVVIQNEERGAQFFIFGGNIIDADVVRPDGDGKDLLGEFFVDLSLTYALKPHSITVVRDGSDGQEARIRVVGEDFPWPLFPPKEPTDLLDLQIQQDYILTPGQRHITIETTVQNVGLDDVTLVQGEVILAGSSVAISLGGVPLDQSAGRVSYLTMQGTETVGASYGYLPEEGKMVIPFQDAAQTGALMGTVNLPRGEVTRFTRYFFIGDRDAAQVTDAIHAFRGDRTGYLAGLAVDMEGTPVANAVVTILDARGNYLTRCLTEGDGTYSATLPAGDVTLTVTAPGRQITGAGPYAVQTGQTTVAEVILGQQGSFYFRAVDQDGEPIPARATLTGTLGQREYLSSTGTEAFVSLIPDTYQVVISRGIEYGLATFTVEVPADGTPVTLPGGAPAVLDHVVDTTGWLSGDFHLHQSNSNDSWTLMENRVASLLAEGVEVAVPTDHDQLTDLQPVLDALGLTGMLVTAVGNEVSVVDYGHFNYFPITVTPDNVQDLDGTHFYFDEDAFPLSASELFQKMRENEGQKVVQINHPRDGASGYFSMIGYNADTGRAIREDLAQDFDALEVKGDVFGEDSVLPDYFSLINQGIYVAAMGNSDAHRGRTDNGYPRTYLRVRDDRTEVTGFDEIVDTLRGGHTSVSVGIFVDLTATAGGPAAGPGDVLNSENNAITLHARLQCAAWADMQHFSLYANGELVALEEAGGHYVESPAGTTQLSLTPTVVAGRKEQFLTFSVNPAIDSHYLLLAWADADLTPVSGDRMLGYNSVLFVDVDGDGFVPPGNLQPLSTSPTPPGFRKPASRCGDGPHE